MKKIEFSEKNPIYDYRIEEITEESGLAVLHVSILSKDGTLKYRICSDEREPNLLLIKQILEYALETTMTVQSKLVLEEFTQRLYLFVTLPDDKIKQYTANAIH